VWSKKKNSHGGREGKAKPRSRGEENPEYNIKTEQKGDPGRGIKGKNHQGRLKKKWKKPEEEESQMGSPALDKKWKQTNPSKKRSALSVVKRTGTRVDLGGRELTQKKKRLLKKTAVKEIVGDRECQKGRTHRGLLNGRRPSKAQEI